MVIDASTAISLFVTGAESAQNMLKTRLTIQLMRDVVSFVGKATRDCLYQPLMARHAKIVKA